MTRRGERRTRRRGRRLVALEDEDIAERALSAIALRLDGKPAAATVTRRKRAVFYNALDAAATGKRRVLARNPLDSMRWKPPEVAEKVDRRAVANPRQARELLTALTYIGGRDRSRGARLVALFACMYYAAHDDKGLKHQSADEIRPCPSRPSWWPSCAGISTCSASRRTGGCSAS
ncbi:MAG: hypothetical protein ACRDPO_33280 [Streptosporangiaceae bacterium]